MFDRTKFNQQIETATGLGPDEAKALAGYVISEAISEARGPIDLTARDRLEETPGGARSIKPPNITVNWSNIDAIVSTARIAGATKLHIAFGLVVFLAEVQKLATIDFGLEEAAVIWTLWKHRSRVAGVAVTDLLPEVNETLEAEGIPQISEPQLRRIISRLESTRSVSVEADRALLVESVTASPSAV